MGVEIERKYLVSGAPWDLVQGRRMVQGYVAQQDGVAVRVRIAGSDAWLTVKGPTQGATRVEVEVTLPVVEAEQLLALCGDRVVEKVRHRIPVGDHVWDVDRYLGRNAGLATAEVELDAEDELFTVPDWVGAEVTHDLRYANAALANAPFDTWERG